MIIDFHTHTFPDRLAERAVGALAESAKIHNYLDGTAKDLRRSMAEAGVDYSVLLPVATKPGQQEPINRLALEINQHSPETGLISFGGIHPDNQDYRRILQNLAENGVKGIKLHPVFQQTFLDDIRYLRIISCACEQEMIVLVHAGYDISHPHCEYSTVPHITAMLDTLKPPKLVLAHMGGWNNWLEAEDRLAGRDVWLDTSFSLLPLRHTPHRADVADSSPAHNRINLNTTGEVNRCQSECSSGNYPDTDPERPQRPHVTGLSRPDRQDGKNPDTELHLPQEAFLRLVRKHGAGRILFGSDSPWGGQAETISYLKEAGLTPGELDAILGGNAAKLLGLRTISGSATACC